MQFSLRGWKFRLSHQEFKFTSSVICIWKCIFYICCERLSLQAWSLNVIDLLTITSLKIILLTHWGWVTHVCISKTIIIGSDNARCQTIIWTSAGILLIKPLGINISEILIAINTFSFKKVHLKMSSWFLMVPWDPEAMNQSTGNGSHH